MAPGRDHPLLALMVGRKLTQEYQPIIVGIDLLKKMTSSEEDHEDLLVIRNHAIRSLEGLLEYFGLLETDPTLREMIDDVRDAW
jgi:hypothetical protein